MTPETRQFLQFLAARKQGRAGFSLLDWDRAQALAGEALAAGFVRERPAYPHRNGFQLTDSGNAYLAGGGE